LRRKPILAVAVFALVAVVAARVVRRPQKGERSSPAASPSLGAFDSLEIERQGARTIIRRQQNSFMVTAPVIYPADQAAARAAFEALAQLDLSILVTDQPSRRAELGVGVGVGVGDGDGVRVSVARDDRRLLELVIGKTIGEGTMVRLLDRGGPDQVWQAAAELHDVFDKSPADWRDRSVTAFDPHDAETIEVVARDGARITLEKRGEPDGGSSPHSPHALAQPDDWEVVGSSIKLAKIDPLVPREMIATLSSLRAADFADGVTLASAGLDQPALTVTVGLAGGAKVMVLIGNPRGGDDSFVENAASPQIFLVKRFNVERIARRPAQFREKILCDISDADVVQMAVTSGADSYLVVKGDGGWRAARPRQLVIDPAKVAPLASVFRGWRAPAIAEDPPAGAVAHPWAVIAARSKRASCSIEVGAQTADQRGYFARIPGAPLVYVVPKWMIDRVVVKLAEIRKP
jgi:hypothetical protein